MNFYFDSKNQIKKYPTSFALSDWDKIIKKENLDVNDIYQWHLIYTPWFYDEVNMEIAKKEFDNLSKK